MLQQLTIENFVRIPFADVRPTAPVLLIAGHNEAGKSSLAEALRFVFLDDNPRVSLKRDRVELLTNGASKGNVTVMFDNNTIRRNVKDGKPAGDTQFLPNDLPVASICLGAAPFATMEDVERRKLIMRLANVDLSVDRVAERMLAKGIDETTVKKYRPLLKGGLPAAFEHAKRSLSDARGQWKEVTGEVYGSQKAEGWKPAAAVVPSDEAGEALAELDTQVAELKAAHEAEIAPVQTNITQLEQALRRPDPLACPHCAGALLLEAGTLKKYEGTAAEKNRLKTQLNLAQMKLGQLREAYRLRALDLEGERKTLQDQIAAAETAATKERRATELHREAQLAERLSVLLSDGPDGIAAELIALSLKPLNERLLAIGQAIGWTPAAIMGDMRVRRVDGHAYRLLSESARWRVDAMLSVLISELGAYPWLVFDRMDVLNIEDRGRFLTWLNGYAPTREDETSIIVLATLKAPPLLDSLPNVDVRWIENGEVH